ncbi:hypothetical protein CcaverHIS002_0403890 [Cutaneotrichosporon cavernicola]|uniref:Nitroreductase domain-containing protein n=1 Tax=Cutaneotrichosporon cavernicola TaxID=279322 RepID=A0AA48L412_9TREE|nr:uncharacterized protein CcaverHIS019_0403840 [Cutaneotrichosporon cavernicola]BEI83785.1 hypothetical protein CcaverHIS002_0403890 [Cutaneotrichosporon cavernicola]BEI91564.1 hypothetical protein CcaverHIS019_0403840 [Cutaneotrichosporon cavernicola]BEI99341.1 hypothetical protein CcaverHIS631_0403840 [Cutaneotrichosporon cavernicola]BEJ07116.1 hypothetical protein CcaverHIS641_0403850 [Cutaneotrichosporon cavernicola]
MTISNMSFADAIEARRSYYNITNESTLTNEQLEQLVADAIKYTPSSFNSQTSRAVLVTGEKNKALWNAVWEAHKANLKEEEIPVYEDKFKNSYSAGYGTIVFYEDQDAIDGFVKNFPIVQWTIKDWVQTSNGMAQFIAWTALASHGMGGNLQHYGQFGPANAEAINKNLGVPSGWKIPLAMLAFGVPADINAPGNPAFPKTFQPLVDGETGRVLVRH